jgi:hypothetical protein
MWIASGAIIEGRSESIRADLTEFDKIIASRNPSRRHVAQTLGHT